MYTYLWIFFVFSFLGWCAEVIFAAVRERRFVNRGFLTGVLCPIYGLGVVLIDLCLRPFKPSLTLLLIGSMVIGSLLEWLTGSLLEKVFRQKWWDYSDDPHNLGGYICLRFSLVWAVAAAAAVGYALPFFRGILIRLPRMAGWVILIVFLAVLLVDLVVTAATIITLNRRLRNLDYVSRKLKQGSPYAEGEAGEEQEKDWQREAARLKEKYEKSMQASLLHRRLLLAFPNLGSVRHNEELENLRRSMDALRKRSSRALHRRNELAVAVYEEKLEEGQEKPFAFGLCFPKLFWIYMIGCVVGFVLENLYALAAPPYVFQYRVGLVFGPFIPVYGFGAVAFTLVLYPMYNQKDLMIFLASMVIGASFEFLCSFLQQSLFGTVSWEYSDSPLNINGRTNLLYAFFWGILGLVWVKDLYPVISRTIQKIPKKIARPLTAAAMILMAADMALSAGAVYRRSERINEIPAVNAVQTFFDDCFPDSFLDFIYPGMEYVGRPDIIEHEPPLPPGQD